MAFEINGKTYETDEEGYLANLNLYELFPYGPAKQACKYAGLPKPTGCV